MFKTLHNLHYEQIGKEVRCIEDELPFEIPDSWECVRLDKLGIYKKGPFGSALTKSMFVPKSDNSIKVYEQKNAIQKNWKLGDYYISKKYYFEKMQSFTVNPGDIIVSCAGTIGETYIMPFNIDAGIINQALMKMTISRNINVDYFLLVFNNIIKSVSTKNSKGSAIKNIPPFSILKQIIVPIPPREEQERIINKINELVPLIESYKHSEELLYELNSNIKEQLKRSILQYAIEGKLVPQDPNDEPASVLLERIRKEKEKLIAEGKIKKDKNESIIYRRDNSYYEKQNNIENCINNELPFEIPNSWEWIRLGNLTYNHGQKEPNCNFCYIDIGSVNNEKQMLNKNETVLSADKAPSRARKIVKFGDILYSTVRPYLHNMCIINRSFSFEPIASTGFAVLTCHSNYLNEFLFIYMMSPIFDEYANSNENSKGVAYPAINDSRLSVALVPVPPAPEQQKIIDNYKRITRILS